MNVESYWLMNGFIYQYLSRDKGLKILDVGACNVNGTHRPLFAKINNPNWEYTGLDLEPGKNVDVVAKSEYDFGLDDESFDVVVSGNVAEHVKDVSLWIKEIARITKVGGLICIITPSRIDEHRFPVDCWRIMPDGLIYVFEVAGLDIIKVAIDYNTSFRFTVGVAKKKED